MSLRKQLCLTNLTSACVCFRLQLHIVSNDNVSMESHLSKYENSSSQLLDALKDEFTEVQMQKGRQIDKDTWKRMRDAVVCAASLPS